MIITYDDVRNVRPISENMVDEKRLRPYIEETEKLNLIPAFGAALYRRIEDSRPAFAELFTGGYYDEGRRYFAGLKDAAGYLAYSRFVRNQNVNVTAFGVTVKRGEFSEPADDKTVVRVANDAEKTGLEYLNQCIAYLKFKGFMEECSPKVHKRKFIMIAS